MIKYKATGIYLPAFNKSGIQKKNYKKILGIYKFNLLTRNSKTKFYALGGINHKNLKKIKILNAVGFSGISLYKKKPAQINGPVL